MFRQNLFARLLLLASLSLLCANLSLAQKDEDINTRSITSLDFQAKRPKAGDGMNASVKTTVKSTNAKRRKNIAVITNSKRRYNLVKKIPPKVSAAVKPNGTKQNGQKTLKTEELGVTFWRLRPKNEDDDDAPTFRVKVNNEVENWTAERVGSNTKFRKGDKVRFTIESSRTGYLYIINREFYADGTAAPAEMIFPTLKTRNGGDNRVTAGNLIEIPGAEVAFPYYNVNPKRPDYAGEELLIIITPEKLPVEIGMKAQPVGAELLQKWMGDWLAEVEIFDAADGEGVAYTRAEAEAANSQSRALTQEEPLPQTIYRVKISADSPLVVPFQMQAAP